MTVDPIIMDNSLDDGQISMDRLFPRAHDCCVFQMDEDRPALKPAPYRDTGMRPAKSPPAATVKPIRPRLLENIPTEEERATTCEMNTDTKAMSPPSSATACEEASPSGSDFMADLFSSSPKSPAAIPKITTNKLNRTESLDKRALLGKKGAVSQLRRNSILAVATSSSALPSTSALNSPVRSACASPIRAMSPAPPCESKKLPVPGSEGESSANETENSGSDASPTTMPKPTQSYASLISTVIMSSAEQKLSLNDIYLALQEKFPYFQSAQPSWKNSIRHNLSLNRAFLKIPRSENEKGKGFLWGCDLSLLDKKDSKRDANKETKKDKKKEKGKGESSRRRNTVTEYVGRSSPPSSYSSSTSPLLNRSAGSRSSSMSDMQSHSKAELTGRAQLVRSVARRFNMQHFGRANVGRSNSTPGPVLSSPTRGSDGEMPPVMARSSLQSTMESIATSDAEESDNITELLEKVNIDYSSVGMNDLASVLKARMEPENLNLLYPSDYRSRIDRQQTEPNLRLLQQPPHGGETAFAAQQTASDFDVNMFLAQSATTSTTNVLSGLVSNDSQLMNSGQTTPHQSHSRSDLNLYNIQDSERMQQLASLYSQNNYNMSLVPESPRGDHHRDDLLLTM